MTKATIPPLSDKQQGQSRHRRSSFYSQTVDQNNARLDNKPASFDSLLDEIKFLESELLCRSESPML